MSAGPDDGRGEPRPAHRRRHLRLRSLLLLVVAVPTIGMVTLGLQQTAAALDTRDRSLQVEEQSEDMAAVIAARIALNGEMTQSSIVGVAADLGVNIDVLSELYGIDYRTELAAARIAVDADPVLNTRPELAEGMQALRALRTRLNGGTAGIEEVNATVDPVIDDLDEIWYASFDELLASLRTSELAGALGDHARVAESAFDALQAAARRTRLATELIQQGPDPDRVAGLVDATARQRAAFEHVDHLYGPATQQTWEALRTDPDIQRFEATLQAVADDYVRGELSPLAGDPAAFGAAFVDATPWIEGVSNLVDAAATDLRDEARGQANAASQELRRQVAFTVVLTGLALVGAHVLARSVAVPMRRLEAAAHEIEHGRFDLPPLEATGPRELADTAVAFNEMARTLEAVEGRAEALAVASDDPILDQPLPGRIGRALQDALDRLHSSIQEAEERRRELEVAATHDGLTGLLNRNAAIDTIDRDLGIARRTGAQVAVLFVDLDGLKKLNDEQGHAAGDEGLRQVAEALRATTRAVDTVARLGGDEFLVATVHGNRASTAVLAERILEAVASRQVPGPSGPTPLRCSIGVALSDPSTTSADVLIQRADAALYVAKRQGGARIAWHDPLEGSVVSVDAGAGGDEDAGSASDDPDEPPGPEGPGDGTRAALTGC